MMHQALYIYRRLRFALTCKVTVNDTTVVISRMHQALYLYRRLPSGLTCKVTVKDTTVIIKDARYLIYHPLPFWADDRAVLGTGACRFHDELRRFESGIIMMWRPINVTQSGRHTDEDWTEATCRASR